MAKNVSDLNKGLIDFIKANSSTSSSAAPIISNLTLLEVTMQGLFTIKYKVTDSDSTVFSHRLMINGEAKNIIPMQNDDGSFTYAGNGLSPGSSNICYVIVSDGYNKITSTSITIQVPQPTVYGFRVDTTNPSSVDAVTYIEGAVGVASATITGYNGWANRFPFNQIRPCAFKEGKVLKYIKPDDFTLYTDGSSVPINVDIMIEIPKVYINVTSGTDYYEVRISPTKIDDTWHCYAHMLGTAEKDYAYVSAYLVDGSYKSLTENSYGYSAPLQDYNNLITKKGEGYMFYTYFMHQLIQVLSVLAFKTTAPGLLFGQYTATRVAINENRGCFDKSGMIAAGKGRIKLFGLQDFICPEGTYLQGIHIGLTYNSTSKSPINGLAFDYSNTIPFYTAASYGFAISPYTTCNFAEVCFKASYSNLKRPFFYSAVQAIPQAIFFPKGEMSTGTASSKFYASTITADSLSSSNNNNYLHLTYFTTIDSLTQFEFMSLKFTFSTQASAIRIMYLL